METQFALANAKIKLEELNRKAKATKESEDPFLYTALYSCIEAVDKVPQKLLEIDEAIKEAQEAAPLDPKTIITVGFLEWSKRNLVWTVERASEAAKERIKHLEELDTPAKRKAEMELCKEDTLYWFKWYAWTADPRNELLWAVPFVPFDYQTEFINWLEAIIYRRKTDALLDKSRDMGATWMIICMFAKYWLMPKGGASFQALVGSIKASDVDELGNPSTILEKLRLQFKLTPKWMLPKRFDTAFPLMKCVNPENGSTITGETANEDFGRSGRYTAIWFDEFAKFELAEAANTASSQSTNTRIYTYTPYGKGNYAYRLRMNGNMPIMSLHWTKHPFKDEDWYKGQQLKMTPAQIAQELDIDYEGSQEGRVFTSYNELYHVITKSEFMSAFPQSKRFDGSFKIPDNCFVALGQDWGSSEGDAHKNMLLWFFVLKEGSVTTNGIDLSGSVFMFHEHRQHAGSTVRMCASYIRAREFMLGVNSSLVTDRLMSHEAKSERDTYSLEHGYDFRAWSTDLNAGIAQVNDYLELHAFHQPHPFREYTRAEKYPEQKKIMGRPRFFIISDDDQGSIHFDEVLGRWLVNAPVDDEGAYWTRQEFPSYHFPEEDSGKPTKRLKPEKKMDDAMDVVRCVAATFFPPIAPLTKMEQMEKALPEELKLENIMKESPEDMGRSWMARKEAEARFNKKQERIVMDWREKIYEKFSR